MYDNAHLNCPPSGRSVEEACADRPRTSTSRPITAQLEVKGRSRPLYVYSVFLFSIVLSVASLSQHGYTQPNRCYILVSRTRMWRGK